MNPTTEPINLILLAIVIVSSCTLGCLVNSPEALERVARRMRARARALHAAREAYASAYKQSFLADARFEEEQAEARRMFLELSSTEEKRIA